MKSSPSKYTTIAGVMMMAVGLMFFLPESKKGPMPTGLQTASTITIPAGNSAPDNNSAPQAQPAEKNNTPSPKRKIKRSLPSENPKFEAVWNEAERLTKSGKLTDALKSYKKARSIDPHAVAPLLRMGEISLALLEYRDAQNYFEEANKTEPGNAEIILALSKTAIRLHDLEKASTLLQRIEPSTDESRFYAGVLAAALNKHEESKTILNEVLKVSTKPLLKEYAQKILTQYEVFALNKSGQTAHLQVLLAEAFNGINEEELAILLGLDAIKRKHDYRDAWIIIGHASLKLGRYEDSRDSFKKAVDLDSQKAESYFFLGLSHKELKNFGEAKKAFLEARRLHFVPEIHVTQQLAGVLFELQEFESALKEYQALLEYDASDVNAFFNPLFITVEKLHNADQAVKLSQWSDSLYPLEGKTKEFLAWAQMEAGLMDEAKKNLQEAEKRTGKTALQSLLWGKWHEKSGNAEDANNAYEQSYDVASKTGDLLMGNLARTYYENLIDR